MTAASLFQLLQSLDQRCRENASGLPIIQATAEDWSGVGFRVNDIALLAQMDEVVEILMPPQTIRVPGVKHWIKGFANVRGNLMPVVDMRAFLFGEASKIQKENRILVIHLFEVSAALLVEEVYGLRRFQQSEWVDETEPEVTALRYYLLGTFVEKMRRWSILSIEKLVKADQFFRVV